MAFHMGFSPSPYRLSHIFLQLHSTIMYYDTFFSVNPDGTRRLILVNRKEKKWIRRDVTSLTLQNNRIKASFQKKKKRKYRKNNFDIYTYLYMPALMKMQTQFLLFEGTLSIADWMLEKFPWPEWSTTIWQEAALLPSLKNDFAFVVPKWQVKRRTHKQKRQRANGIFVWCMCIKWGKKILKTKTLSEDWNSNFYYVHCWLCVFKERSF